MTAIEPAQLDSSPELPGGEASPSNGNDQPTTRFKFQRGKEDGASEVSFDLEVDDDRLVRLGEGNFGMVFAAKDTAGQKDYALKALYAKSVPDAKTTGKEVGPQVDERLKRVELELTIRDELLRESAMVLSQWPDDESPHVLKQYAEAVEPNNISQYLVLPEGYSTAVGLPQQLAPDRVKFSSYAYVMERYKSTLKQIIEASSAAVDTTEAEPEAENGTKNDGSATAPSATSEKLRREASSYVGLGQIALLDRAFDSLTVADNVARGLQILHSCGYRHQDLKPANVFFRNVDETRHFALGDLGFLLPIGPGLAGSTVSAFEAIGTGTMHYRSPEQKDFGDEAECSVTSVGDDFELRITDPKFFHTHIAEGDFAFFPKDDKRLLMSVSEASIDASDGSMVVVIGHRLQVVESESNNSSSPDHGEPPRLADDPDGRTVVSFRKAPTARTDLFGLGALLYDIVTAGRSPERFYDLLRPYDVEALTLETSITDFYGAWKAGGLIDPNLNSIFDQLHGGGRPLEPLPDEIVTIILRLLLSQPKGTLYRDAGFDKAAEAGHLAALAWHEVIVDLRAAKDGIAATYPSGTKSVFRLGLSDLATDRGHVTNIDDDLPKPNDLTALLRNDPNHSLRFRWLRSAQLVRLLLDLLRRSHVKGQEDWGKLHLASPELILLNRETGQLHFGKAAKRIDDANFARLLRDRDPLLTRNTAATNQFRPCWWELDSRAVRVQYPAVTEAEVPEGFVRANQAQRSVRLNYDAFSASGVVASAGDCLIAHESRSHAAVFDVVGPLAGSAGRTSDLVEVVGVEGAQPKEAPHILVKRCNSVDYYGGVIAAYLYSSLFEDLERTGLGKASEQVTVPCELLQRLRVRPFDLCAPSGCTRHAADQPPIPVVGAAVRADTTVSDAGPSEDHAWAELRAQTFRLLSWLTLGGYMTAETDQQRWSSLRDETEIWAETVLQLLIRDGLDRDLDFWDWDADGDSGGNAPGLCPKPNEWEAILDRYLASCVGRSTAGDR